MTQPVTQTEYTVGYTDSAGEVRVLGLDPWFSRPPLARLALRNEESDVTEPKFFIVERDVTVTPIRRSGD